MVEQRILIFNKHPQDVAILTKICSQLGSVQTASSLEETIKLVEKTDFDVLVADESFATYPSLKGLFRTKTSIFITGIVRKKLNEIAKSWPLDYYVDYHLVPLEEKNNESILRALITAAEHSFLKNQVERLKKTEAGSDVKLKEAYFEINKIKNYINNKVLQEVQRRVSIEAKYLGVKKEKLKIENTLKKLYIANDVTSLLDIVYDIKEIVKARGISIYILDENDTLGKFLKPMVWNDAILPLPDSAKHFVLLDSDDFAADATRGAQAISTTAIAKDKRFSRRYAEELPFDMENILCVPIMHDLEVIGVLEVYNKISHPKAKKPGFTSDDQKNMLRFCEHISIAITKLNLIQYDPLTGLLRPDAFFDKVILKLKLGRKRQQEGSSFAMVMGDVDWFKNYNDRNGHEAGNKLLRELAGVLKSSIREEDILCRYGGEEFLFFLSGISSRDEALGFTERIRKNIEEYRFENQEFQPSNNLTMSFGLTYFSKKRIKTLDVIDKTFLKKLANEADMGMSEAKGKHRAMMGEQVILKNRVCMYSVDQPVDLPEPTVTHKQPEEFERRKQKRFQTSTILVYKTNTFYKVTKTINLSLGGAKIPTDTQLDPNQVFDLILVLGNNACQLQGEVRYSIMAGENLSHYFTGLRFQDMSVKDRKILMDYFSSMNPREGFLPH